MKEKAREFAVERHGEQKYGDLPYFVHLDEVAEIASKYGDKAITVAYLHDVVEDTETELEEIENEFDSFTSKCVAVLTDERGANRKERKAKTYDKMAKVGGELELALLVKAADRLANLRACVAQDNTSLLSMYKNEHPTFKSSVYRSNLCETLWKEIEAIVNA